MRLLVVADLHYALPQYDWLVEIAPRFDLVVIAGDHLDVTSMVDFRAQTVVVQKYIARLAAKTKLLVCSGNHDLDARSDSGEKIARWIRNARHLGAATDGDSLEIDGTFFSVCPWWDGPQVKAAIGEQLAADAAKRAGRQWIWIHHAPPAGSPVSWGGSRSYGDTDLVQWIDAYKPDIVFSGHVHQSPFVRDGSWADRVGGAWVFNAGHQYGAPPAHIIVDTEEKTAIWLSAAGAQIVHLDQPLTRPLAPVSALPAWLTSAGPAAGPSQGEPARPAGG